MPFQVAHTSFPITFGSIEDFIYALGKTKLRNVCVNARKRQRKTAKSGLHATLHSVMSRGVKLRDEFRTTR